jgi:hypothetical protein
MRLAHRSSGIKSYTSRKVCDLWRIIQRAGQVPHLLCRGWEYGPRDVGMAILRGVPFHVISLYLQALDQAGA